MLFILVVHYFDPILCRNPSLLLLLLLLLPNPLRAGMLRKELDFCGAALSAAAGKLGISANRLCQGGVLLLVGEDGPDEELPVIMELRGLLG